MSLENALVTGSTSGIGLATAKKLAAKGLNIVLHGIETSDDVQQLISNTQTEYEVKVFYHSADLSQRSQVKELAKFALDKLGSIDVLVNNAGVQHTDPVENFSDDVWDRILAVNLTAPFSLIKECLPGMKERGYGRVVNISSVHGLVASANKAAYCSAKHGLIGLTKVVALEAANSGVTCNAIAPGWVLTPLIQKQIDDMAKHRNVSIEEAQVELVKAKQPMHRFASPDDIADCVLYLCSPSAHSITGTTVEISGGWTAQ